MIDVEEVPLAPPPVDGDDDDEDDDGVSFSSACVSDFLMTCVAGDVSRNPKLFLSNNPMTVNEESEKEREKMMRLDAGECDHVLFPS